MNDPKQMARDALHRAIEQVKGQSELARRITELAGRQIETGHIYYWLKQGSIPTDACVAIEKLTKVSRRELRPDDYWSHWPDLSRPDGCLDDVAEAATPVQAVPQADAKAEVAHG